MKLENLESSFLQFFVNAEMQTDVHIDLTNIPRHINLTVFYIKNFVKFIKANDDFRSLTVDTQSVCLKVQLLSCLVLLSLHTYNPITCSIIALGR